MFKGGIVQPENYMPMVSQTTLGFVLTYQWQQTQYYSVFAGRKYPLHCYNYANSVKPFGIVLKVSVFLGTAIVNFLKGVLEHYYGIALRTATQWNAIRCIYFPIIY
jgi:hypothetical protein